MREGGGATRASSSSEGAIWLLLFLAFAGGVAAFAESIAALWSRAGARAESEDIPNTKTVNESLMESPTASPRHAAIKNEAGNSNDGP